MTWFDTFPPATPTGLAVNNPFTGYSLILSWNPNSEADLECYAIYCNTDNSTFYWIGNISAGDIDDLDDDNDGVADVDDPHPKWRSGKVHLVYLLNDDENPPRNHYIKRHLLRALTSHGKRIRRAKGVL